MINNNIQRGLTFKTFSTFYSYIVCSITDYPAHIFVKYYFPTAKAITLQACPSTHKSWKIDHFKRIISPFQDRSIDSFQSRSNLQGKNIPKHPNKFLTKLPQNVCAMAALLKSGHFPTKSYLRRMNRADTSKCNKCNVKDDKYLHMHTCCRYAHDETPLIAFFYLIRYPYNLKQILKLQDAIITLHKYLSKQSYMFI